MCVIIYLPKEKNITNADLRRAYKANPDSVGYMYAHSGKLVLERFLAFRPFLSKFRQDLKKYGAESDFTIHFRIATSGKVDIANCHPFRIDKDHGFVHNGVITGWGSGVCSDTNEFRTKVLTPMAKAFPDFMESESVEELIRGYVGTYNKLVFMKADGNSWILNAPQGTWVHGVWFSNTYWKYESAAYGDGYEYGRGYGLYMRGTNNTGHHGTDNGVTDLPDTKTSDVQTMLLGLTPVTCSGCGKDTIHQDKVCNDCWSQSGIPDVRAYQD